MSLTISPPIEEEKVLEKSDAALKNTGDPSTIVVMQANEGANMVREQLFQKIKRTLTLAGEISITDDVSPAELRRKEVFLTLKACNLQREIPRTPKEIEEGKEVVTKQLFEFPLVEKEFNAAWALLPPILANEIHDKVIEVNITWGPSGN